MEAATGGAAAEAIKGLLRLACVSGTPDSKQQVVKHPFANPCAGRIVYLPASAAPCLWIARLQSLHIQATLAIRAHIEPACLPAEA